MSGGEDPRRNSGGGAIPGEGERQKRFCPDGGSAKTSGAAAKAARLKREDQTDKVLAGPFTGL
jgi:hypothetical protein